MNIEVKKYNKDVEKAVNNVSKQLDKVYNDQNSILNRHKTADEPDDEFPDFTIE